MKWSGLRSLAAECIFYLGDEVSFDGMRWTEVNKHFTVSK